MSGSLLNFPKRFWDLGRKVERLFELERKMQDVMEALTARLTDLETRMTYLEAAERGVITEARAAAGAAATAVASGLFSDVVTRLTRAEMRVDAAEGRLPPPS